MMLKSENDQLPIDEGRLQLIAAQVLLVLRELHAHDLLYRCGVHTYLHLGG